MISAVASAPPRMSTMPTKKFSAIAERRLERKNPTKTPISEKAREMSKKGHKKMNRTSLKPKGKENETNTSAVKTAIMTLEEGFFFR